MQYQHRRTNFTPSDDALIRQQPMSGVGLTMLETLLVHQLIGAQRERLDELGVSLDISDDHDRAVGHASAPLQRRFR